MTMGRPVGSTKQFCRNGHDTYIVGRYTNGVCRTCQRVYSARSQSKRGVKHRTGLDAIRLPAAPLLPFLRTYADDELRKSLADVIAGRTATVTLTRADEVCSAMRMHLSEVYGHEWEQAG